MAKRQDRKDRRDESRGMKRYYRDEDRNHDRNGDGKDFITGHDPDIGRDSFSGMPDRVVMGKYPPFQMRNGAYIDDTMSGIDAIQVDSEHEVESHLSHQK